MKNKSGFLALAFLVLSAPALARTVVLVSHNLRSAGGVLSTLSWKACAGPTYEAPCVNPANAWVQANGLTGSTATWDWDGTAGVLTATGTYEAATYIGSNTAASSIVADKVVNLRIDLGSQSTSASSYTCIEGTFLAGVGAHGCGAYSLGPNAINDSTLAYNVGGNATCINRNIGGDDTVSGTVRGLTSPGGDAGCESTLGAFDLWTIVQDDEVDGGTLILSNGLCQTCANVSYMTFQYPAGPSAGNDAVATLTDTAVNTNALANDTGFTDPVTVAVVTAPLHGSVAITGSPGPRTGVVVTYTPAAGYQGADSFQYSISDGTSSDTATVAITVAGGLPSSPFAGEWPMYQANPAHTGYVTGSLNPAQFSLRWEITGATGLGLHPVAVGDGKVFVSAPSYFGTTGLYAYDAGTGSPLWNVGYSNLYSVNPPSYANGRVYLQTGKGTSNSQPLLRAYDAATGQVAFESVFGAQWENYQAPTILDDVVYVNGGAYGGMYAFGATDGASRWFNGSLAQEDRWTPAVDGTHAYACLNGVLSVVNRATGTTAFTITGPSGYGVAVPVLGGANDAIAIYANRLVRFDIAGRAVAWEKSGTFTGQPAIADDVIYAINGGALQARARADGALLWSWTAPGDSLSGAMVVTDSHVLVSGSSKTYAVNLATWTSDWNYPAAGALAIGDHSIFIASPTTGKLTAIRVGPPGAYDDSVVAYLSTPTAIDVLENDDGFTSPTTVSVTTEPQNGTAEVTGSPGDPATLRIVYTPDDGFQGVDTFEYSAGDGVVSGTALVTVEVRVPQANADLGETKRDTAALIDVLKNDVGFADPVTVTITSAPATGAAVVTGSPGNAAGVRIRYTPPTGFSGAVSLQYQVTNGINTDTATVTINVLPYRAKPDTYYVLSGSSGSFAVAANDVGFQDPVTLTIVNGSTQGSAYVNNSPGPRSGVRISYYAGSGSYTDTLTYAITDGTRTDSATVTFRVVPYIAQDDEATTGKGTPVTISVTQNDLGFSSPRTVGLYANPLHGTATVSNADYYAPVITYSPEPGFLGDDTFQYAIDDGSKIGIATVTVHVINDTDNDQVDDGLDNCLALANADQRDADGDGYGNLCDADFNNDGRVNFADLGVFRLTFASADPETDLDGNGVVNFGDLARFRALFGKPPGPSALRP